MKSGDVGAWGSGLKAEQGRKVKKRHQKKADGGASPPCQRSGGVLGRLRSAADGLLHLQAPAEPPWRYFWPVLALAFAARAGVALSGDFIVHPDEIMQLLEPAHRLAFGNGVVYWEFFYGARSWLLPGLLAGLLKGFDAVGLGQPFWYVGGVKLALCAASLSIPAAMYFCARRHLGETAARVALLAGAFWYELVGFAHKPLTEFVATMLVVALLALCLRILAGSGGRELRSAWLAALLAVLAAAIRMQYAPLALVLLGLCFVGCGKAARVHLALAAAVFLLAVGAFDAATWNGQLFHSYLTNIRFNMELRETTLSGASPAHQYLWWLLLASAGASALCVAAALRDPRRHGFLLLLVALTLLVHSTQAHKEYRYIFVVIPLWLLLGAGVVTQLAAAAKRPAWAYAAAGAIFGAATLAGILNALPMQSATYRSEHQPKGIVVRFLRGQDPVFAAYRYLAGAPGVTAVWQTERLYHSLPGYYYLHRRIPFYDAAAGLGNNLNKDLETLHASVSHFVIEDPSLAIPGYVVEKQFGTVRILRRESNEAPVRQWRSFTPTRTGVAEQIIQRIDPDAPPPPRNGGISFLD